MAEDDIDPAFIARLTREWKAATGGMSDRMADAVARALLPAQRRLDARQGHMTEDGMFTVEAEGTYDARTDQLRVRPVPDWKVRHRAARLVPVGGEVPVVQLLDIIEGLARQYANDYVITPGIVDLITGTRRLLDTDVGRLDQGLLDEELDDLAQRIGYCLDHEQMRSECLDAQHDGEGTEA